MPSYLRMLDYNRAARNTGALLSEIDSAPTIAKCWTPIAEYIERENEIVLGAKEAGFTCDVKFKPEEGTGSIRVEGGEFHGEWRIREVKFVLKTDHFFNAFYRIKAGRPGKEALCLLIVKDLLKQQP